VVIYMDYLIGLDIGTSSIKGVLMTSAGEVIYTTRENFNYFKPNKFQIELIPNEYLSSCYLAIRDLVMKAESGTIKAVCASSASGNLLVLDKENKPLTNIIGWQDMRVKNEAEEMLQHLNQDELYRCAGWKFDFHTFPLAQLCYVRKHQPELLGIENKICMSTEYLYYTLTGKWGISCSAATPSYLIMQEKGIYNKDLLDAVGIQEEQLPPILESGKVLGISTKEAEVFCGIPKGTSIVLGTFDHPSAARGVGVLEEGQILLSCGTSWVTFSPIHNREKGLCIQGLLDPFLSADGCYGVMTSIASLAERLDFYVSRYIDDSNQKFEKLSELAMQSKKGASGLQINILEKPNDDIITNYEKVHIARAIMEGTAQLLKEKMELLNKNGISTKKAVMVGGPSEDSYWIELISEVCNIEVEAKHGSFAGAVGAAILAGIGIGIYKSEKHAQEVINGRNMQCLD